MNLPVKEEVRETLQRFESKLHKVVTTGWQGWLNSSEFGRAVFIPRLRANIVFDRMIEKAIELFKDDSGVRFVRAHETMYFVIDEKVKIRFKKGDETGLSSNIPTQTALSYNDHECSDDENLFGEKDPSRVEVVYTLDRKTQTSIEKVWIVARDKKKKIWFYDIMPQQTGVVELPTKQVERKPVSELVTLNNDEVVGKEEETKT